MSAFAFSWCLYVSSSTVFIFALTLQVRRLEVDQIRYNQLQIDHEQLRSEFAKMSTAHSRLESLCRAMQKQNKEIKVSVVIINYVALINNLYTTKALRFGFVKRSRVRIPILERFFSIVSQVSDFVIKMHKTFAMDYLSSYL